MIRRRYGAGPLHLLGHLVLIAAAAWALAHLFQTRFAPEPLNLALWLAGGALLHDLVLLPAYATVDRVGRLVLGGRRDRRRAVPLVNYVRAPALVAGVLALVYAPRILDRQPGNAINAAGHPWHDYAGRWLAITVLLFAVSAILYAVRVVRVKQLQARAGTAGDDDDAPVGGDGD